MNIVLIAVSFQLFSYWNTLANKCIVIEKTMLELFPSIAGIILRIFRLRNGFKENTEKIFFFETA